MTKLTLDTIATGYQSLQKVNTNNTAVVAAVENTLSRDGTAPNYMSADFDMNSHRILNLPTPQTANEPARLIDITSGAVLTALSLINISVDTVAALKAYTMSAALIGQLIYVRGYTAIGDGGEGLFRIQGTSPGTTDQGTRFNSNTSGYYFVRQNALVVTPLMFGAVGDGTTNDATALTNCIVNSGVKQIYIPSGKTFGFVGAIAIPVGVTIYGDGPYSTSILRPLSPGGRFTIDANGVTVRDLQYSGYGDGFKLGTTVSCSQISFRNIYFSCYPAAANSLGNTIWLHNGSDCTVDNCNFYQITYGVLQQTATTWDGFTMTNCKASDMYGDMCEFNSGASGLTSNIRIAGNFFRGSHTPGTPATEKRFVGCTRVRNVTITGNQIEYCSGDAAIHLEEAGGYVNISENRFYNCNASGGNDGWIYLLNTAKDVIISNNWFIKDDSGYANFYAISTTSNFYANRMIITGNHFLCLSAANDFGAMNLQFHSGQTIVSNNYAEGVSNFALLKTTKNTSFTGNRIVSSVNGIYDLLPTFATGNSSISIYISNNYFACTGYAVLAGPNSGGTGKPEDWRLIGNTFDGNSAGYKITDAVNCYATGNAVGSNCTNHTIKAGTPDAFTLEKNDFLGGTGALHP